jgi:hypothetical protein
MEKYKSLAVGKQTLTNEFEDYFDNNIVVPDSMMGDIDISKSNILQGGLLRGI